MVRYWDHGLYPPMEDGPDDRGGPFEWLNEKLVDCIAAIPITAAGTAGDDFSLIDLQEARRVGSEASCKTSGRRNRSRKRRRPTIKPSPMATSAWRCLNAPLRRPNAQHTKSSRSDFVQVHDEFKALEKVIDEKFGDVAPNLSACRTALNEMKEAVSDILDRRRKEEPDAPRRRKTQAGSPGGPANPSSHGGLVLSPSTAGSLSASMGAPGRKRNSDPVRSRWRRVSRR